MILKPDLMSEIDAVLDAQRDPQLEVMLTLVFSGYEHEPPAIDGGAHWGYTEASRTGFKQSVHQANDVTQCECMLDDVIKKMDLFGTAFHEDAHKKTRAYMAGLTGQDWRPQDRLYPFEREGLMYAYYCGVEERVSLFWHENHARGRLAPSEAE